MYATKVLGQTGRRKPEKTFKEPGYQKVLYIY